jgi:hypothetical protein
LDDPLDLTAPVETCARLHDLMDTLEAKEMPHDVISKVLDAL